MRRFSILSLGTSGFLLWALSGPIDCVPLNSEAATMGSSNIVDLSGAWEFKADPLDVGRAEKWFEDGVVYERQIQVPGAWNAQAVAYESQSLLREYESKRIEEQKQL